MFITIKQQKIGVTKLIFGLWALKAKVKGLFTATYWPKIGHLCDNKFLASLVEQC